MATPNSKDSPARGIRQPEKRIPCPDCEGKGTVPALDYYASLRSDEPLYYQTPCSRCGGAASVTACQTCGGDAGAPSLVDITCGFCGDVTCDADLYEGPSCTGCHEFLNRDIQDPADSIRAIEEKYGRPYEDLMMDAQDMLGAMHEHSGREQEEV